MNYFLITKDKEYIQINEEERNKVLRALNQNDDGMIFIKSINRGLRGKNINSIVSENDLRKDIREQNPYMRNGRLHDGTPVIQIAGTWYLAGGTKNDEGFPEVEIDGRYYPEIYNYAVIPENLWISIENGKVSPLVLEDIKRSEREEYKSKVPELMEKMGVKKSGGIPVPIENKGDPIGFREWKKAI